MSSAPGRRRAFNLKDLTDPPPTVWSKHERRPLWSAVQQEAYLDLLQKNYEENGLEFNRNEFPRAAEDKGDAAVTAAANEEASRREEALKQLQVDGVSVRLTCQRNKVKVHLSTALNNLKVKYYDRGKAPPLRALTNAYKDAGLPPEFIQRISTGHEANLRKGKRLKPFLREFLKDTKKKRSTKKKDVDVETAASDCDADETDEDADDNDDEFEDEFDMENDDDIDDAMDDDPEFEPPSP